MTRVAFIGLGVMGYPMAGHLSRAGHDVCVYNRTNAKADAWCSDFTGHSAATPAQAATESDVVFCCVGNDNDVRGVMLGEHGIFSGCADETVVVDHTTASAGLARELADKAAERGLGFVDAPVSGGQAGAENGQLTIMAGGSEADVERARPVMDAYAKSITRIGDSGAGQLAKAANQLCIAGVLQGLSEALHFAACADLDIEKVVGALSAGAAQSWQMDNRWRTMANGEFDFGFAVDWMRKDLSIALSEAE
ncbi:MAG: NAD(P)-dependent oxidoreductase, partial [Pseudomonadota bacterium]